MNTEAVEQLQKMVDESRKIVFFGGAGISTESGIPDFRSKDGLFAQKERYSPRRILSKPFYLSKPEVFYDFYRTKMLWPGIEPNRAHLKLAELEAAGKLTAVVTQNIDGLHQAAGNTNVLELHGSIHRNYCLKCKKMYDMEYMLHTEGIPKCACGGAIKPDVVLYEERLNRELITRSIEHMKEADMLIIGGTSLAVHPAAGIIKHFKKKNSVLINRDIRGLEYRARLVINGSLGEILGAIKVNPVLEEEPVMEEKPVREEIPARRFSIFGSLFNRGGL